MPQLRLRLQQAPNVLRRAIRHPDWLLENARLLRWRRAAVARPAAFGADHPCIVDERQAVMGALGATAAQYDAAQGAYWAPPPDPSEPRASWNARQSLQSLVSVVVVLIKPLTMIETGVARGYTTAVVLTAMDAAGVGHLYSIDLPALQYEGKEGRAAIGDAVPQEVRRRWTLELGPSRSILPGLATRVAPVDIFLHDADHTYPSQITEYRTVWPHLRPGGVLLSDDVANEAFLEFATDVGVKPFLIWDPALNNAVGILAKPGGDSLGVRSRHHR